MKDYEEGTIRIVFADGTTCDTKIPLYFERKPFEIKEAGLYKTRDGRKAFVSKIYKTYVLGLIMGDEEFMQWRCDGFIFDDKREDNQDLISKWED